MNPFDPTSFPARTKSAKTEKRLATLTISRESSTRKAVSQMLKDVNLFLNLRGIRFSQPQSRGDGRIQPSRSVALGSNDSYDRKKNKGWGVQQTNFAFGSRKPLLKLRDEAHTYPQQIKIWSEVIILSQHTQTINRKMDRFRLLERQDLLYHSWFARLPIPLHVLRTFWPLFFSRWDCRLPALERPAPEGSHCLFGPVKSSDNWRETSPKGPVN